MTSAKDELLAADHPYYFDPSRYRETDAHAEWHSWGHYFGEFGTADVGANLVLRWDIWTPERMEDTEHPTLYIVMGMGRHGYIVKHKIDLTDATKRDYQQMRRYLRDHWEFIVEMWAPISTTRGKR